MLNPYFVKYGQTITVAQSGADFNASTSSTPIQDAIDSITDASAGKKYGIAVYPGIYAENIIGKDHVNVFAALGLDTVTIAGSTGTLFTCPSTSFVMEKIDFLLTPTTSGHTVIDATAGGFQAFLFCRITIASATNGVTATALDVGSDTVFGYNLGQIVYSMTGSSAGANTHSIVKSAGTSSIFMDSIRSIISIGDVDDNLNLFDIDSTGQVFFLTQNITLNVTNAAYSGTACVFNATKSPVSFTEKAGDITMTGAGSGTGTLYCIDSTTNDAVLKTNANDVTITGFANNYFGTVATGDELDSIADFITADEDLTTGAGIVNFITGEGEYGQLAVTGGTEYTIDAVDQWHAYKAMSAGVSSDHVKLETGLTGAITAFADATGGQVTVTSAGHGMVDNGEYVSITGTTNYNDIYQITNITTDTFEITETFNGDDATGTFIYGDHFVVKKRGAYRLSWSFSGAADGNNKFFDFAAFKGTTPISGTLMTRKFATAGDVGVMAASPIVFLERDDVLFFAIRGTSDATNITLSEGSFNINKVS